jgi:hypothetical protein
MGTAAIDARPPSTNVGPMSVRGPKSAAQPPSHTPTAMPARIAPMIPV